MATKTTKTKVTEIISEQKRVNNSGNEGRLYDIEAVLHSDYGKMRVLTSGTVKNGGEQIATFEANQQTTSYHNLAGTLEEKTAIITAIDEFVADVKAEQTGVAL